MKRNIRHGIYVFTTAAMLCCLNGCVSNDVGQSVKVDVTQENEQTVNVKGTQENGQTSNVNETQENEQTVSSAKTQENNTEGSQSSSNNSSSASTAQNTLSEAASGEDLDVAVPDSADDDWYMKGNVYTNTNGNRLEVFFDDEGMIEFAVNGLSLYYTTVDNFQFENNWRIYACDDGTTIVYYPGEPAHLEICDGDHAGLYEAGGDKVK